MQVKEDFVSTVPRSEKKKHPKRPAVMIPVAAVPTQIPVPVRLRVTAHLQKNSVVMTTTIFPLNRGDNAGFLFFS